MSINPRSNEEFSRNHRSDSENSGAVEVGERSAEAVAPTGAEAVTPRTLLVSNRVAPASENAGAVTDAATDRDGSRAFAEGPWSSKLSTKLKRLSEHALEPFFTNLEASMKVEPLPRGPSRVARQD